MKLALVVQRYGVDINGGAELHARYIAEHLGRHAAVVVFTTCARDYITWRNELAPGRDDVNGIPVHRFPVKRPRDVQLFARRSERVFQEAHSFADELAWLDAEGPVSPALIRHIGNVASDYDYMVFFSYRYYHAYYGTRRVPARAVLVPTAERDEAIGLKIFGSVFRGVRAVMYNSFEERAMIQAVAGNQRVPAVVVGVGSSVPDRPEPARFRAKFNLRWPFIVYVGRIDRNKGCTELFDFFTRYVAGGRRKLTLLLIGHPILPIPDHPSIRHIGFVDDQDKFDAMAAAAALIMPSYFESLSMVALEAWALGRPVLANGRCDVLKGQCIRGQAGLYYETYEEFAATLDALLTRDGLGEALGANGRAFFQQQYGWPVIERKYLQMFERLDREAVPSAADPEPFPGWFQRRRRDLPPASEVVRQLPAGPVRAGLPAET